jgi:hypothetical protein
MKIMNPNSFDDMAPREPFYKNREHQVLTHCLMQDILRIRQNENLTVISDDYPTMVSEVSKLCNIGAHMNMVSTAVQLQHAKDQQDASQGFMSTEMKEFLARIAPIAIVAIVAIAAIYFYLKGVNLTGMKGA